MSKTSLTTAKKHLRVDASDEDSLIAVYIDAAEDHIGRWCEREFGSPLPASVTAAVLLLVGNLYENRESAQESKLNDNQTIATLLQPYRSYDGALGAVALPPASALLDDEPIIIGDDWSRIWRWKDDDGTAINVTGYTGTFELFNGDSSIHSGSLTISDAVNGEFTFAIEDAVTATFDESEYWYRVRVTSPAGVVTTLDRKRVLAQ